MFIWSSARPWLLTSNEFQCVCMCVSIWNMQALFPTSSCALGFINQCSDMKLHFYFSSYGCHHYHSKLRHTAPTPTSFITRLLFSLLLFVSLYLLLCLLFFPCTGSFVTLKMRLWKALTVLVAFNIFQVSFWKTEGKFWRTGCSFPSNYYKTKEDWIFQASNCTQKQKIIVDISCVL